MDKAIVDFQTLSDRVDAIEKRLEGLAGKVQPQPEVGSWGFFWDEFDRVPQLGRIGSIDPHGYFSTSDYHWDHFIPFPESILAELRELGVPLGKE